MKQYITYTGFIHDRYRIRHPNEDFETLWDPSKLVDTGINEPKGHRSIAYLDLAEQHEDKVEKICLNFSHYAFTALTAEETVAKCIEWYGDYFELDEDGFTIIDNRPDNIEEVGE